MIRVDGVTVPFVEGGRRGHHLEDRAGLVDARHDRVDEPRRIGRRDRLVVVRVVRRVGRHRVDLAGVRVHHDGRGALGPVGDPRREELLLDAQLESGVDRQAQVRPGLARLADRRVIEDRLATGIALRDDDPRLARQGRLVLLLDAVLAAAVAIHEPEQVGRQARARAAADLRIDALRLRFEREREDPFCIDGRADPVGDGPLQAVREDEVLGVPGQPIAQGDRGRVVEPQDAREFGDGRPAPVRGQLVGRRDQAFALDGRGQHDGPGPVVDVAALARRVDGDGRLRERLRREPIAIDDLPVGEPGGEQDRAEHEHDQQEQEAPAGIGPAQHRSVDRLARRQDERFGELAETGVDGQLADGRLAAEPVEVGAHVGRGVVEALALESEAPDVEARSPRRGPAGRARRTRA